MTLIPGAKLGPYEIIAPLGAGGMGEVYRARDTRLGRDVAVKVLPQHLSDNADVRARFEREAKTISSLNHPNICTLFDVGREGETDYLVMELIEGETLAQRLTKGPLPTADVLRIGAQVADALDRAHRAGVIHRDLKPGNVMLTKSGAKLMDFGLARSSAMAGPVSGSGATMAMLTHAPTVASPLTAEGAIVGTFQYMAPEQLEGRDTDARSDIWALGCVLYEMATGQRPFGGGSQASLISSIMKEEPRPMIELVPLAPNALARLVRECLAKDAERRLQSAHDIKLQLEWIAEPGSQSGVMAPVTARPRRNERAVLIGAVLVTGATALAAGLLWPRSAGDSGAVRATIPAPVGGEFSSSAERPMCVAISPDGRTIVYSARVGEGRDRLYVRDLDAADARPLAGTEEASQPFFSPDGRSVGFFSHDRLRRVDVAGGPVVALAPTHDGRGGTWGAKGDILFTDGSDTPVSRVSADGGPVTSATVLDRAAEESTNRYPYFLPDGRHFLYLARRASAGGGVSPTIYVGELGSSKRVKVLELASNVAYAHGHVFYVREGILQAQPFDPAGLRATGPAISLVDDVRWDGRFSRGVFAVSANGTLACMTGTGRTKSQLAWLDRSGHLLRRVGDAQAFTYGGSPQLSPDGRRAAMCVVNPDRGTSDVYLVDVESGHATRLTLDDQDHPGAAWSADGAHVYVDTNAGSTYALDRLSLTSAAVERILTRSTWMWPMGESPDGRSVLFVDDSLATAAKCAFSVMPHEGGALSNFGKESQTAVTPQVSPDGRYVVYTSDRTGRPEVYVASFPEARQEWQVSASGGVAGHWGPGGRELYFIDPDNRLMAVDVSNTPQGLQTGSARPLFVLHGNTDTYAPYAPSPDGQRFLVLLPPEGESEPPVTLITNWPALLAKK
jgi:Tol biopolymer transport system component